MAEKSASSPHDVLTREEWRAMWGVSMGVSFSNQASDVQTLMDDLLNTAHENCAKRHQYSPWAQQGGTITLESGTAAYQFPANFKRLVAITEAPSSGTIRPRISSREEFFNARQGADWADLQGTPIWFFEYMDDSEPPRQMWRRYPTPDAAGTASILYRPFFAPLAASGGGSDRFTWLTTEYVEEIRYDFLTNYHALISGDHQKSAYFAQLQDRATSLNREASDVASEDPQKQQADPAFTRLFG